MHAPSVSSRATGRNRHGRTLLRGCDVQVSGPNDRLLLVQAPDVRREVLVPLLLRV